MRAGSALRGALTRDPGRLQRVSPGLYRNQQGQLVRQANSAPQPRSVTPSPYNGAPQPSPMPTPQQPMPQMQPQMPERSLPYMPPAQGFVPSQPPPSAGISFNPGMQIPPQGFRPPNPPAPMQSQPSLDAFNQQQNLGNSLTRMLPNGQMVY